MQSAHTLDGRRIVLVRIAWVVFMALLAVRYIGTQFDSDRPLQLSRLIHFGSARNWPLLPEVEALKPRMMTKDGFDGQFYAQLAIRPTLRPAGQVAPTLDLASYRARRILLPALAWSLGGGQPAAVLDVYASLNVVFYLAFCAALAFGFRARTVRDFAVISALALAPGVLFSIMRALTDLPAATLSLLGLLAGSYAGAGFMAIAILTREASMVSLAAIVEMKDRRPVFDRHLIARILIAVVPFAWWAAYVRYTFSGEPGIDPGNFTLPLAGWLEAAANRIQDLSTRLSEPFHLKNLKPFGEAAGLVAVFSQMMFLGIYARWRSPTWRYGAGFVVVALCLSIDVLDAQFSYSRALLPLTIAYFLELRERNGPAFWLWLCAGALSTPFQLLVYLRS